MEISFLDIIWYCKSLPRRRCMLSTVFSNHLVNFDLQASEKECFTQTSKKLAKESRFGGCEYIDVRFACQMESSEACRLATNVLSKGLLA